MSDPVKAWVRTVWPAFISYLTALLVTWLGDKLGIEVDTNVTFGAVLVVLLGAIYLLGHWLERRSSATLKRAGRWLISLGADLGQPSYDSKPTPTVEEKK